MATAILGWGSLIWDDPPSFAEWHEDTWHADGPTLKLEFSRVSESRLRALTLVIDEQHGAPCQVSYTLSERKHVVDVVADVRCREGCNWSKIGCLENPANAAVDPKQPAREAIRRWAVEKGLQAVVWTDLRSNFKKCLKSDFSVQAAVAHLKSLEPPAKVKAAEYLWRAADFVDTPLRRAMQAGPWF